MTHAEAILPNAASFALSATLASYVVFRRGKSALHWTLLALLVGIVLWTGGGMWRHMAVTRPELLVAFGVLFLGVCVVPPAWLLLAARFARVQIVEERPAVVAAFLAPGALFYLGFLTNERHLWFAEISLEAFVYRPLFWVMVSWGYACVLGGVALFLRRAGWMVAHQERPRAALLALAAGVPLGASVSYLTGLVAWPFDPTPPSLGVSAVLLFPLIFRMSLLEHLPLVRRDVIEHLRDGVVIADAKGTILDANPAAVAVLGRSVHALRGESLEEVLRELAAPEDQGVLGLAFARPARPDRRPGPAPEISTREGRHLRVSGGVVEGGDGDPAGRFVVLHDRSAERRVERVLRQAQKLESVGMLAAGIAHEVNNPLAWVRANLGQLARAAERTKSLGGDGAEGEGDALLCEMPEVVAETTEGVERIARIVAGLRQLSRGSEDDTAEVDVNGALREAVRLAQLGPGPAVDLHLAETLPRVRGSREGLIQVFLNLLINARQAVAGRTSAAVRARTRPLEDGCVVVVEDEGPGMTEAVQERIFDPFFTTKGPDEGTGLGLPIAFDIVREHHGSLQVDSRPGGGARFTVVLPASPASR